MRTLILMMMLLPVCISCSTGKNDPIRMLCGKVWRLNSDIINGRTTNKYNGTWRIKFHCNGTYEIDNGGKQWSPLKKGDWAYDTLPSRLTLMGYASKEIQRNRDPEIWGENLKYGAYEPWHIGYISDTVFIRGSSPLSGSKFVAEQ